MSDDDFMGFTLKQPEHVNDFRVNLIHRALLFLYHSL